MLELQCFIVIAPWLSLKSGVIVLLAVPFFSHDDFGYLESFMVPYEFEKGFSYCIKNIIKILMEIVLNQ